MPLAANNPTNHGDRRLACRTCKKSMVLLELSVVPVGVGESLAPYVAKCVDLIDRSGLDYELHSMGTIVEGELEQVLDIMRQCVEEMAKVNDRVSCTAKLDYRRGKQGQLLGKVARVEQELGRPLKNNIALPF
jgi:uncharacterized protein (TIGR00106 family)